MHKLFKKKSLALLPKSREQNPHLMSKQFYTNSLHNLQLPENSYNDCFGEWWEHKVNHVNRDETEAASNPSNCDDLVLQNGGTDSAGNIAQSTLFPDKTNLRNGDLTREFISCSSYFVNFRDTAEMKEVF